MLTMSTGRNLYSRYSKVLNMLSKIGEKIPYNMRIKMLHLFRNTGGKTEIAIRYILVKTLAKNCGTMFQLNNMYF